jgi:hypothetical protein
VRGALADFFIAHQHSLRDLELEVLTSVLYTQPQALGKDEIALAPLWAHGPTKRMQAEAYLDSLVQASGVLLGGCDFRYGVPEGQKFFQPPPGAYSFAVTPPFDPIYYTTLARKMGGCPGGAERAEPGGLVPALAKREVLAALCQHQGVNTQDGLVPPLSSDYLPGEGLPQLFAVQFSAATGRMPTTAEQALFVDLATAKACPDGRCDYKQVGTQLCMALFASALYNNY